MRPSSSPPRSILERIQQLASETAIYGVSTIVGRLVNFLMVPIYLAYFSQDQYGVVTLLYTAFLIFNQVYQYGMESAYLKYASGAEGRRRVSQVFSTAIWSLLGTGLLLSALVLLFRDPLSELVRIGSDWSVLFFYAIGILGLDALTAVPFAELRLQNRPIVFAVVKFTNILVNIGLNIYWIILAGKGIEAIFWSNLVASAVSLLLLIPVYARLLRPTFDRTLWRSLLAFGLPFLPTGISYAMVDRVTNFFLGSMKAERVVELYGDVFDLSSLPAVTAAGADTAYSQFVVGTFSAVWKLGVFMMLVSQMFRFAWQPFFLQHAEDDDAPELFSRVFSLFTAGALFVLLAVSYLIDEIVAFPFLKGGTLIPVDYWVVLYLVPIALLAYLFQGWYFNFTAGGYILKKSGYFASATMTGAAFSLVLNFLLVPRFGLVAAAWITVAAYGVMAGILYVRTNRIYPIPYAWGKVWSLMLVGGAFFAVWFLMPALQFWYWEIGLLLGYLGSVILLGVTPFSTIKRAVRSG